MTDDELRERIMTRLATLAKGRFTRQVNELEGNALADYLKARLSPTGIYGPIFSWPGFVGCVVNHFPDQTHFMRMPAGELKALMKIATPGSDVWLQCRAAQMYWRMCWLDSQEERK